MFAGGGVSGVDAQSQFELFVGGVEFAFLEEEFAEFQMRAGGVGLKVYGFGKFESRRRRCVLLRASSSASARWLSKYSG